MIGCAAWLRKWLCEGQALERDAEKTLSSGGKVSFMDRRKAIAMVLKPSASALKFVRQRRVGRESRPSNSLTRARLQAIPFTITYVVWLTCMIRWGSWHKFTDRFGRMDRYRSQIGDEDTVGSGVQRRSRL